MAVKGVKKESRKNGRESLKRGESPAQGITTLDQDQVLKAMMAASKGKARSDSEDGSAFGDESDRSGSEAEDEDGGEEDVSVDSEAEGSQASSSSSSRQRGVKRSRTLSPGDDDDKDEEGKGLAPASTRIPEVTSRIKLHTAQPAKPAKSNPFDTPKAPTTATFASLGLSKPLINALAGINITKPTEIQSACVGPILAGRDCIGGAKTGSGKTMAFALPIVERIARDPYGIWAVILTPTRELAYQLTEQFLVVGKPLGLTTVTIVGGMDMLTQAQALEKRPHIVVATPGRLVDLLRSDARAGGILSRVKVLVLDEADRMLTPTFAPELQYLFSQIPPKRQTCLFTATVSDAIMELANKPPAPGKEKPYVYRVESDTLTVANLKQKYLFVPSQIRDPYLHYLLHHPPAEIDTTLRAMPKKKPAPKGKKGRRDEEEDEEEVLIPSTIIFTQRCATAHLLHLLLNQLDIPSVPLHSHLTQPQRLESLAQFRSRQVPVLVTTDVGSRGLDIPEVAMVINWDCPRRSDDYVHRVGRTARAGKGGVAVTVITERDVELIQRIEGEINVKLVELELPEEQVLEALNSVSLARRMATMEMHDSGFGERQATNKAKAIKRAKRDAAAR